MFYRTRPCVECPNCQTRYVIGASPYPNGSYLVSNLVGASNLLTLYCSFHHAPRCYAFNWDEVDTYTVSDLADRRGYGSPEEVQFVRIGSSGLAEDEGIPEMHLNERGGHVIQSALRSNR
jgi:hypothetical protein